MNTWTTGTLHHGQNIDIFICRVPSVACVWATRKTLHQIVIFSPELLQHLRHLWPPEHYLAECHAILPPNRQLSCADMWLNIHLLKKTTRVFTQQRYHNVPHPTRYRPDSVALYLRGNHPRRCENIKLINSGGCVQMWGWRFETPPNSWWRHYDDRVENMKVFILMR